MIRPARVLLPVFALGLAFGACKEEAASLDSGVDGAKQGDELTPAEQTQFCEAADAYGQEILTDEELVAALCVFKGVGDSLAADGSADTCEVIRKDCVANSKPDPDDGMCSLGIDWADCKATVDEIEACYEEFGAAFAARVRSFSCSKMAEYQNNAPTLEIEEGPDCSLARAKCPSVVGG